MNFTDKEKLLLRMMILTRQLGNVPGTLGFFLRTLPDEQDKRNALYDHLKCDLADLLCQVIKLIEDLKLNRWEVEDMGIKRWKECRDEFRNKGKSQFFI